MTCKKLPCCVANRRDIKIPCHRGAWRLKQQGRIEVGACRCSQVKHQEAEAVVGADRLFEIDFIETELLLKSSISAPQGENDRQAVGKGDELDAPRVEERLQRLSEERDEPKEMCERWPKRSAFWERWCEFAVVVSRLNQLEAEAPTGNGEESTKEINELWRKRTELATEMVDAAVATVEEAIFKVTVTASLLSEGEIWVVLTPQCLGDCDRALAVDGDGEQCVKTLEPDLWTACSRVREQIAGADEDAETLGSTWWRDLQKLVGQIAGCEAMTRAGLRAKGQVFQDLFNFASLMDGLSALQMSYVRDFGNLAYRRLRDKDSLLTRRAVC